MAKYMIEMTVGLDGVPQVTGGLQQIDSAADRMGTRTQTATGRMASGMGDIENAAGRMAGSMDTATGRMAGSLGVLHTSMMGLAAGFSLGAVISQLHSAGMAIERLNNSFAAATGSVAGGAASMSFVRAEAQRLGLDLLSTADSYMKLAAAARGTALEGNKTQQIFSSVAGASRALGLSAEQTNGALMAISQMMSKGSVMAEELRGQLGERLPGAFQIAARAMGVSTAELGKMLEAGSVISDEFLPKFAAELQKTFPPGEKAMSGMTAETMRLKTAWFDLKTTVMENGGDSMFTGTIRGIKTLIKEFEYFITNTRKNGVITTGFAALNPNGVSGSNWVDYRPKEPLSKFDENFLVSDTNVVGVEGGASYLLGDRDEIIAKAVEISAGVVEKVKTETKKGLTAQQKEYQAQIKDFFKSSWDNAARDLAAEDFSSDAIKKMGLFTAQPTGFTKNPTLSLGTGQLQSLEQQADAAKALTAAEAERLKTIRDQTREYERQQAIIKYIADLEATNAATAASMVGMNSNGGFDSIADQTANQLAIQKAAHEERLRMIDVERKATIGKGLSEEQTIKAMAALDEAAALERQKNTIATGKIAADSYKSQLGTAAFYVDSASQLFGSLAEAQDQSSRKGFESAKAYSMAAAIMNTAAGIMNAFATSNNIYVGMAMAAVVAAAGAVQVAKIAATSFGGGGSIAAPGGAYMSAGGGPTGSGAGGSITNPYSSVRDSQTGADMDSIVDSMDNAAIAMNKTADSLLSIGEMFKTEVVTMLMNVVPNRFAQLDKEPIGMAGNFWKATGVNQSVASLKDALTLNVMGAMEHFAKIWKDMITGTVGLLVGGPSYTQGAGVTSQLVNGEFQTGAYLKKHKDGGIFTDDKTWYVPSAVDQQFQEGMTKFFSGIKTDILTASKLFGMSAADVEAGFSGANTKLARVATAGRTPEDIQKDWEVQITAAANALANTIPGLKDFQLGGEELFATYSRLSNAMLEVNDSMLLIGASTLPATGSINDLAYTLQNLMGGSEAFAESIDTYFTSIFTDSEQEAAKLAQAQRAVNYAFAEMHNTSIPQTREEFRSLVNGLDLTTESGAQTFATLMGVAESFGMIEDAAEELMKTNSNLMVTLYDMQGKTVESIMLQRQLETEGMDPTTLAIQNQIYALEDLNRITEAQTALEQLKTQAIQDSTQAQIKMLQDSSAAFTATAEKLKANLLQILDIKISANQALLDIMGGNQTVLSPEALYQQKKAAFEATKGLALGGNAAALTSLPELAKSFLAASQGYNASGAGYQSDFANVTGALATIAGLPSTATLTLDIAQQQLFELKKIQEATTKGTSQQNVLLTGVNGGISGMQSMLQSYLQAASSAQAAAAAAATAQAKAAADTQAASQAANTAAIAAAQAILDQAKAIASAQAQLDAAKAAAAAALALAQAKAAEDAAAAAAARAIYSTVPQDPLVRAANAILHPGQEYWLNNVTGVKKWLPYGETPSFAVGTPYVPYDMNANIHQGERIFTAPDNYAITKAFVEGQSGSGAIVEAIGRLEKRLERIEKSADANVRVNQAGFIGVIEINQKQEKRLAGVEAKTKLQEQTPRRKAA